MFGVSDVAEVLAVATDNTFVYNQVLPISVNKGVCVCVRVSLRLLIKLKVLLHKSKLST